MRSCSVAGRVCSRRRLPGGLMGGDGCARFSSRNTQEYTRIYFWASKKCEYAYLRGFPSVFCMYDDHAGAFQRTHALAGCVAHLEHPDAWPPLPTLI